MHDLGGRVYDSGCPDYLAVRPGIAVWHRVRNKKGGVLHRQTDALETYANLYGPEPNQPSTQYAVVVVFDCNNPRLSQPYIFRDFRTVNGDHITREKMEAHLEETMREFKDLFAVVCTAFPSAHSRDGESVVQVIESVDRILFGGTEYDAEMMELKDKWETTKLDLEELKKEREQISKASDVRVHALFEDSKSQEEHKQNVEQSLKLTQHKCQLNAQILILEKRITVVEYEVVRLIKAHLEQSC